MAKKKAKPAKKTAGKKKKPAKKAARKSALKKSKPAKKKAQSRKASPKKKSAARNASARAKLPQSRALHVRIDHATQGPDGHETPADRLSIRSDDFLWLYVEAVLPSGEAPVGEYSKTAGGVSASPQQLGPPDQINGQYRFGVIHYALSPASTYLFRFADNLAVPAYQAQWEIVTTANTKT